MEILVTAIAAFIATNIDDIVILTLLFSQTPDRLLPRQIVWGQYLGFTTLLFLSSPGFFGGLILTKPWIGLLGLLPIAIGLKSLRGEEDEDDPDLQTIAPTNNRSGQLSWPPTIFAPQTTAVAAITIANGGDNIGIYVPLFAGQTWGSLALICLIFFVLVGVWCGIAYALVQHPAISTRLRRFGHRLVPIVLILLGIYILLENKSYRLFLGPN